eukprot:Platyproteum_vivax@DN11318_c0_g1_i1.p1
MDKQHPDELVLDLLMEKAESHFAKLRSTDGNLQNVQSQIEEYESTVLDEKPWYLRGEVSTSTRPKDSLLEVDLDIPRYARDFGEQEMEADTTPGMIEKEVNKVDEVIFSRLKERLFDDVVRIRKYDPLGHTRQSGGGGSGGDDNIEETLEFTKNKVGLADMYAMDFLREAAGVATAEEGVQQQRKDIAYMLSKIMFRLDSMCSGSGQFTPRPPKPTTSNSSTNVAAIAMEDIVPVTLQKVGPSTYSTASGSAAPEEIAVVEKHRSAKKKKRQKKHEPKESEEKVV